MMPLADKFLQKPKGRKPRCNVFVEQKCELSEGDLRFLKLGCNVLKTFCPIVGGLFFFDAVGGENSKTEGPKPSFKKTVFQGGFKIPWKRFEDILPYSRGAMPVATKGRKPLTFLLNKNVNFQRGI